MELHNGTLREIISEGKKRHDFINLIDIKTTLIRYVADERYAHAMQEARLYTSQLAAVDGVVFYDVPGLDSGLAKHIEESKEMLADCDAIILVQRRDIDLKAHEQDLIKFGATGDPYLKLADKLFVFWGQVDLQPSKEVLQDNWQQLLGKWAAVEIPEHRIVSGSAGAHLVLQGKEIPQVGTLEQTLEKMASLTGLTSHEDLIKHATGINELQNRIRNYLDNERTALLKKRCDGMIGDILKTARDIYQTVAAVYPEDPEQAKRAQSDNNNIEFSQWWHNRWQKIQADVNNRFKDGNEQSIKNRQLFKARYEELVKEKINVLPTRQLEQRQITFDSVSNPVFDAAKANIAWREKLYSDVRVMTAELARNLALELQQEALNLIAELEKQLWGSKTVKTKLVQNETIYVSLLEHSLNTLFLRFVRPVVELLIRAPVGSTTRKEARKKMGADIEIIDNYYSGGEPALKHLCKDVSHGVLLLTDEATRKDVLNIFAPVVENIISETPYAKIALNTVKHISNGINETVVNEQDTMISEVEADIRVLEHYLIYGIFEASGFSAFCQQELDTLRDSFLDVNIRGYWTGVVQNEWQAGNVELLKELPVNLQSFQFNTETSDRLKQLRK